VLWREVASEEERLTAIAEDRESELEERAQEENATRILDRLDERGKREIEAIDAALRRMEEGSYGRCARCGEAISVARLRALPEASLCTECSASAEHEHRAEREVSNRSTLTADEAAFHRREDALTDLEVTTLLLDRLSEDDRIDVDELDLECRAGVIYLAGTLPNEVQHELLRQEVMEVLGFCDVDDRIEIGGVSWEEQQPQSPDVADEDETAGSEGRGRKQ
jgi:RNA polymerase-binding transcription factor DksA